MNKYYTDNKLMYFEVIELEDEHGKYEVHAFYKDENTNTYRYERVIPEDSYFDLLTGRCVAEALSWTFNWGVDTTEDTIKDELVARVKKALL